MVITVPSAVRKAETCSHDRLNLSDASERDLGPLALCKRFRIEDPGISPREALFAPSKGSVSLTMFISM